MLLIEGSIIRQLMPSCIEIYEGEHGYSIRSTRFISKDTIIDDKVSFCFINNVDKQYLFVLEVNDSGSDYVSGNGNGVRKSYPLHSYTNTYYYTDTERVCNGYIGYLNHSCCHSNVRFVSANQFELSVVATKDIAANEELTSNYLLYDYTCTGHQFKCSCCLYNQRDFDQCYGQIAGFKSLTYDQQYNLIDDVTPHVLHQYCHDRYDVNEIVDELYTGIDTLEYIDDSLVISCNINRSSHCTTRVDDKLLQKIKLFACSHNVPESILVVVSYLAIISLIKGESVVIESTCNSKRSVHFIRDFFSLSILDVISITTKQVKGPPARVIKHLLHIDSLSYSIAYHDTSTSALASSTSSDLHLCINSDFVLEWLYSSAYDLHSVMAYEERFLFMIEQVIDKWNGLVETLQLLDDHGINEILRIGRSPVKDQTMMFIYESIESNAAKNPDKVALESGCDIMAYESLVHRMTTVACVLQAVGVGPDDVVGILMNRGCDLVAALLGKERSSR